MTVVNQRYIQLSGTSAAAQVVAGAVALLLQAHQKLTPDEVKWLLTHTANGGRIWARSDGRGRGGPPFTSRCPWCRARVAQPAPSNQPLDRARETAQQRVDRGPKQDQSGNAEYCHQGDDEAVFDETLRLIAIHQ